MASDLYSNILLSHFSEAALAPIRSVDQNPLDFKSCYDKPKGLWVSVDGEDDWPAWCNSNMPQWMDGVTRYRVHLVESPKILVLADIGAMYDFEREFGRSIGRWDQTCIDWPAVAARYRGIIIAPYHWPLRVEMGWYYGWDCACGCIWNADAVARVDRALEVA